MIGSRTDQRVDFGVVQNLSEVPDGSRLVVSFLVIFGALGGPLFVDVADVLEMHVLPANETFCQAAATTEPHHADRDAAVCFILSDHVTALSDHVTGRGSPRRSIEKLTSIQSAGHESLLILEP